MPSDESDVTGRGGSAPSPEQPVKQADEMFCSACRAVIKREAEICVKCGVRVRALPGSVTPAGRSMRGGATFHPADALGLLGVSLVIVAAFLPWYEISFETLGFSASITRNGWQSPGAAWSVLAFVFAVLFLGAFIARFIENIEALEYAPLALGVACVAVVLVKLSAESSFLAIGFYLALVGAVLLAGSGAARLVAHLNARTEP